MIKRGFFKVLIPFLILAILFSVVPVAGENTEPAYRVGEEIKSLRTENSKTFYLGKGQYRAEISSGVIHYKDNYDDSSEQWKDIDLTWDGTYLDTAPYILEVKGNQVFFTDKKTGDFAIVEPANIGLTRADLIEFKIVPFNEGIKIQREIVSSNDALTTEFSIESTGNSIRIIPSAVGGDGDSVPVEYSIKDGTLTETIKPDKETVYPITVDPTLTIQPSSKDNYMVSGIGAGANLGTSTYMLAGMTAGVSLRGLVEFNVSQAWGATIDSATLGLYYYAHGGADPSGRIYNAHRLLRLNWGETTSSWNNYKTGSAWTTAGAASVGNDITSTAYSQDTVPASFGWMEWDITAQVQWACDNEATSATRIADNTETSSFYSYFYSKEYTGDTSLRPKLDITYTIDPPTVTTSACTNIAPTKLDGNGEITKTGGVTVTQRGFCYVEGSVAGWVSPTGASGTGWTNPNNVYDGNTATFAYTATTNYITMTPDGALNVDKVRIYAADVDYVFPTFYYYDPDIDIDVYYDGGWNNIFSGTITKQTWVEKSIPAGTKSVSQARVRFNSVLVYGYLYEFQFYVVEPTVADNVVYKDGSFGIGAYSLTIEDLELGTSYLVRAYAQNSEGIGYGSTVTATTESDPWVPEVDTNACSNIGATSLDGNGDITYYGGANVTRRGFTYAEGLKYALDFNGISDYVEMPYHEDYYSNTAEVENFEWGIDTDPLDDSGGSVTWTITAAGSSKAEIDTGQHYLGTRSARLYRDGTNTPIAYFPQTPLTPTQHIESHFRKDNTSQFNFIHGNGTYCIYVRVFTDEKIYYYDGGFQDTGETISIDTWYLLSIRNVNWATQTYDIYLDGNLIKSSATMWTTALYSSIARFANAAGTSSCWVDNILVGSPSVWTWETWINRKVDSGTWERLLRYNDNSVGDRGIQITDTDTVRSFFYDTAGTARYVDTTDTIPLNTDTHLSTSFDGTYIRIYFDGVLKATSADLSAYIPRNNNLPVRAAKGLTDFNFEGEVDEIRNWDDVRTQTEIQSNMYSELVGDEAGLVGYWKLDTGSGVTAVDSTANANDGTISSTDLWVYQSWDLLALMDDMEQTVWEYIAPVYDTLPRYGQRLPIHGVVSGLSFALSKYGSPPSGDVTYTIRDLADNVLASSVCCDAASLPVWIYDEPSDWISVEFDSPIYINGWVRILVEYSTGGDALNCVMVDDANTDLTPIGVATRYYTASGWTDYGFDARYIIDITPFYTYEDGSFSEGEYSLTIEDLTPSTDYRVRAFAENSVGIGYGDVVVAQTLDGLPEVTSGSATNIGSYSVTLTGNITDTGGSENITRGFQWGTVSGNYSHNWSEEGSFGAGTFSHNITDLSCNTTYYWRAFAIGVGGSDFGNELSFNTSACPSGLPLAPTDLIATILTTDTFALNWTKGVGANITIIRISEIGYPTSVTDGELLYSGTGEYTTYNVTDEGWELDIEMTIYYIRAWSYNEHGYSLDYAQTMIGGEMTLFALHLIPLVFSGFYIWKREIWTALVASAGWLCLGLYFMLEMSASPNPTQITDIWMGLFWVCIGLTLVCGVATFVWRPTPQEVWEEEVDDDGDAFKSQYIRGEPTGKTRPLTTLEARERERRLATESSNPIVTKKSKFSRTGKL